jgi:N-acetyl-gamma-glutamylphosphate reductase
MSKIVNYDMLRSSLLLVLFTCCCLSEAFQMQMNLPGMVSKKVIVTGAAGRTGNLVFSLLNKDPRFDAVGLVRSEASAKKLISKTKCSLEEIVISDVTLMVSCCKHFFSAPCLFSDKNSSQKTHNRNLKRKTKIRTHGHMRLMEPRLWSFARALCHK